MKVELKQWEENVPGIKLPVSRLSVTIDGYTLRYGLWDFQVTISGKYYIKAYFDLTTNTLTERVK